MIFDKIKPAAAALSCAVFALSTFSQSLPLIDNAPFKIEPGSSFSASGESERTRTASNRTRPGQVIDDIEEAIAIINQNKFSSNNKDLTADAVDGMLHTLDPHSHYYTQSEWKELMDDYNNEYFGVGVSIISRVRDGSMETYVVSTVPGSPASEANLKYGDKIVAVGGVDVNGRSSVEVSDLIRGANGTNVRITVKKTNGGRIETVKLARTKLPQPTVSAAFMLNDRVGYIGLTHGFSFTTADEVKAAAAKLNTAGMRSLVLDIRGNPGGILEQSVKVAEQFLPSGANDSKPAGTRAVRYADLAIGRH